eukprot:COSAG02_NODE_36573_length_453_cov_0.697740_1_plen_98_part_01
MASWHQAPRPPPQTRGFYKTQAAREHEARLRDEALIALHEQTRKQRRAHFLAPKRPVSAPVAANSRLKRLEYGARRRRVPRRARARLPDSAGHKAPDR